MNNIIVMVLKSGAYENSKNVEYTPAQVIWLKNQIKANLTIPVRFVCFTDTPINDPDIREVSLTDNLPGWWSKIEMFKPRVLDSPSNITYFDLDTVIVGNLDNFVGFTPNENHLYVLKSLSTDKRDQPYGISLNGRIGSGILKWAGYSPFASLIYTKFMLDSQRFMDTYITNERWGDQGFIQDFVPDYQRRFIQDLFPELLISYKFGMKQQGNPPKGTRIVVFHGKPKPWEVQDKHLWIPKMKGLK